MDNIERLKNIIKESKNIVVFSGAGLSTNSGIPDFRSANGIYSQKTNSNYTPEEIISHSFFMKYPEEFYKFYFSKMVYLNAKPNPAHYYFAELEKDKNVTIVTQNIDNLHQLAGSTNVVELHGSTKRNYCMKCNTFYDIEELDQTKVPYCSCGGMIKPDVVLYEEPLDDNEIGKAIKAIRNADTMIVVGTSLTVYPAAGFVRHFRGNNLVLLNKSQTQYDSVADVVIHEDIVDIIKKIKE